MAFKDIYPKLPTTLRKNKKRASAFVNFNSPETLIQIAFSEQCSCAFLCFSPSLCRESYIGRAYSWCDSPVLTLFSCRVPSLHHIFDFFPKFSSWRFFEISPNKSFFLRFLLEFSLTTHDIIPLMWLFCVLQDYGDLKLSVVQVNCLRYFSVPLSSCLFLMPFCPRLLVLV